VNWIAEADADWVHDWLGFDGANSVDGYGPAGVATLVLDLEVGYKVRHRWPFGLNKARSAEERRNSRNDAPKEYYEGSAIILDDQRRDTRALLARYAAQGQPFLLALPHEGVVITEAPTGTLIFVGTNAIIHSDWAKPGQRVVVTHPDLENLTDSIDAVIQSVGADSIELDVDPGLLGGVGGIIMPTRPVLLDPQQSFARYPVAAEVWSLKARAAIFDFVPSLASLALGPLTVSAGFNDVIVASRSFSLPAPSFALLTYAGDPAGTYAGSPVPTFFYVAGVTTIGDLAAALANSPRVRLAGTWNSADVIAAGDEFGSTQLTGGAIAGSVGTGATLVTYDGDGEARPVWDAPIRVETTATDSVQAMTEIVDHDGIPYAIGTADEPDWGRAISFTSEDPDQWQWLKLFFSTTAGSQKAFWLPTWRDDMDYVSHATGVVTVEVDDLRAWWPYQRQHLQFAFADGSVMYAQISAVVDNEDGTWTLSITVEGDEVSLDEEPVLVSWLELCRFEEEDFDFSFGAHGVALSTVARVVQQ
jgi:hypothetical protein